MGRVKPAPIKRIAEELIRRYPNMFTDDFEHNKRVIERLVDVESKPLRNMLAGYVTELAKRMASNGAITS